MKNISISFILANKTLISCFRVLNCYIFNFKQLTFYKNKRKFSQEKNKKNYLCRYIILYLKFFKNLRVFSFFVFCLKSGENHLFLNKKFTKSEKQTNMCC